jgi:hypothetical protein
VSGLPAHIRLVGAGDAAPSFASAEAAGPSSLGTIAPSGRDDAEPDELLDTTAPH